MKGAQSSSNIPFPPRLVKVDLPDDRALTIIVDGEAGAFEIAWDVVLTFAASGDPFSSGPPPSSTIVDVGPESASLTTSEKPTATPPIRTTSRQWVQRVRPMNAVFDIIVSSATIGGFDVAAIAPPVVRSVIIEDRTYPAHPVADGQLATRSRTSDRTASPERRFKSGSLTTASLHRYLVSVRQKMAVSGPSAFSPDSCRSPLMAPLSKRPNDEARFTWVYVDGSFDEKGDRQLAPRLRTLREPCTLAA
jgi:hypothetical protein